MHIMIALGSPSSDENPLNIPSSSGGGVMVDTSNLFDLREHADHGRLSTALVPTSSTWSASTTNAVFQTNLPKPPERAKIQIPDRPKPDAALCALLVTGGRAISWLDLTPSTPGICPADGEDARA